MGADFVGSLLGVAQQICGAHGELVAERSGGAAPVVGNIVVASLAGLVTLACIAVALRMLISPGEQNPDHPKYRILSPDR